MSSVWAELSGRPLLAQGRPSALNPSGDRRAGSFFATGTGLVPRTPVYRVELTPAAPLSAPAQVVPGTVEVDGAARSLLDRAWRSVAAVVIRESGF